MNLKKYILMTEFRNEEMNQNSSVTLFRKYTARKMFMSSDDCRLRDT